MTSIELPLVRRWTPEALQSLSDEFRYEVHEGNLVIMSAAMRPWHSLVQHRIMRLLRDQGRHAFTELGVVLGPDELRTCDVGVLRDEPAGDEAYHPPARYSLIVEVVSASSRREDREHKPRLYADAGVPSYWRVEESADGGAVVHQHELDPAGGGYVEVGAITLDDLEST